MGISFDESLWPKSWKTVEFKEYLRMPKVSLPKHTKLNISLGDTLNNRSSKRNFDPLASLTLPELSDFLFWSAGINRNASNPECSSRVYPSGGGRYPLEIYLSLRGNDTFETGIYHYNVKKHILEKIHNQKGDELIRALPSYPWAKDAAAFIFVTALFERSMRKYQERGYRFVILEAGALIQNFYLVAESLKIGCCGLGVTLDEKAEQILDIDNWEETLIAHCTVGPLSP